MSVEELLKLARTWAAACDMTGNADTTAARLARAVIDLLGEAQPCGYDVPAVITGDDDGPWINADWLAAEASPVDARALARMLLAAADEADAFAIAEADERKEQGK